MYTKIIIDDRYGGWIFSAAREKYGSWRPFGNWSQKDKWQEVFIGPIPSLHRHRAGFRGRRHPQCPHLWGLRTAPCHHAPWPGWPWPHWLPHEDPHRERLLLCDHRYPAPFLILTWAQTKSDLGPDILWWKVCGALSSNSLEIDGEDSGLRLGLWTRPDSQGSLIYRGRFPTKMLPGWEQGLLKCTLSQHSRLPQGPAVSVYVYTRIWAGFYRVKW